MQPPESIWLIEKSHDQIILEASILMGERMDSHLKPSDYIMFHRIPSVTISNTCFSIVLNLSYCSLSVFDVSLMFYYVPYCSTVVLKLLPIVLHSHISNCQKVYKPPTFPLSVETHLSPHFIPSLSSLLVSLSVLPSKFCSVLYYSTKL